MPAGEVVCLAFRFRDDENIEVGFVFISDMAFCVYIFDPRPTGIAAEEDEHLDIREFVQNNIPDQRQLIMLSLR